MIVCQKCGKENQDHYKFCLGCGAELSKDSAPKPFSADTPPHGVSPVAGSPAAGSPVAGSPVAGSPAAGSPIAGGGATSSASFAGANPGVHNVTAVSPGQQPAPAPAFQATFPSAPPAAPASAGVPSTKSAPPVAAAAGKVECPQCGQSNPTGNRFCASCGYNLSALKAAPAAAAPQVAAAAPAVSAGGVKVVLTALRADGSEAGSYPLPDGPNVAVGRDTGSIFAGDSYLSPRHATLLRKGDRLSVRDEASLNGVYIKLKPNAPWPIGYGDVFRIGQEIVRFEKLEPQARAADSVERLGSPAKGYIGRLALVIGRDTTGNAFPVPEGGVHCGRERGDVLFSEDGYVSGLHCRIAPGADGRVYLTDVGSSNGTFVRLTSEQGLSNGDILLMGQQLFRIDL